MVKPLKLRFIMLTAKSLGVQIFRYFTVILPKKSPASYLYSPVHPTVMVPCKHNDKMILLFK